MSKEILHENRVPQQNLQLSEFISDADIILNESKQTWGKSYFSKISSEDRYQIRLEAAQACERPEHSAAYADACECFFLFRLMHSFTDEKPDWAVLTGDYFFSGFSLALIRLDCSALFRLFSGFLEEDASQPQKDIDLQQYLVFIRQAAKEVQL